MTTLQPTPPVHPVRRTLAAGAAGVTVIEVPGTTFRITEASGPLTVKIDEGGAFPLSLGMAYTCPPGTGFKRIELSNLSAEANTVEVLLTAGTITDDRLNVVTERGPIPVIEQPTEPTGGGVQSLAAGASVVLSGVPAANRIRRKAVMVTNFDLANPLLICDALGNAFSACLAGTAWVQNVVTAVSVKNASGTAISCAIGEVWYLAR